MGYEKRGRARVHAELRRKISALEMRFVGMRAVAVKCHSCAILAVVQINPLYFFKQSYRLKTLTYLPLVYAVILVFRSEFVPPDRLVMFQPLRNLLIVPGKGETEVSKED